MLIKYLARYKAYVIIFIFVIILPSIVFIKKNKEIRENLNSITNDYEYSSFATTDSFKEADYSSKYEEPIDYPIKEETIKEESIYHESFSSKPQEKTNIQPVVHVAQIAQTPVAQTSEKLEIQRNYPVIKEDDYDQSFVIPLEENSSDYPPSFTTQPPVKTEKPKELHPPPTDNVEDNLGLCFALGQTESRGIGYDRGYTTARIQGTSKLFINDVTGFIDLRGHHFDDSEYAANVGVGMRYMPPDVNKTLGLNVYYDWRKMHNYSVMGQIAVGLELLSKIDFRFNMYFPKQNTKQEIRSCQKVYNNKYYLNRTGYKKALNSIFFEVGGYLIRENNLSVYGAVSQYFLEANSCDRDFGGKTRVKLRAWNLIEVEGLASYDSLFGARYQIRLGFSYKWGRSQRKRRKDDLFRCCQHNEIIPVDKLCEANWNW